MSMIDKLEIRVPRATPYRQEFATLYRELAWEDAHRSTQGLRRRLRPSRYYTSVVDLREFGHDAILHGFATHGKNGDHKIELLETGKMTLARMAHEVERIFDTDPQNLSVMRVDLTADVPDIPVAWFLTHCRVQYKRWTADFGQIADAPEYSEMGMRVVQTVYFGKRPNVFRFYDKVAESLSRYKQLLRHANPDAEPPAFEEIYGYSQHAVLTRVERQMAAGRVPTPVDTVRKLRNSKAFNPFDRLKIVSSSEYAQKPQSPRRDVYERGMQVQELIKGQGLHRARYALNEQSRGNADRILQTLEAFIPDEGYHLTPEELYQRYQESVSRQLVA